MLFLNLYNLVEHEVDRLYSHYHGICVKKDMEHPILILRKLVERVLL
jgi:hypothetical protein